MAKIMTHEQLGVAPRSRIKVVVHCVAIALAQWGANSAHADSAVGVDTALGNALNPPGRSAIPYPLYPDAGDSIRRSPSGQLYGMPRNPVEAPGKTDGGWVYDSSIDVGMLGGQAGDKNALYRQYKSIKNGPTLDYFEVDADKPDTANFFQISGGGLGQKDQFYGLQYGRYNDWKVKLFFSETQHVFTDTWKSLHSGEGTGSLMLNMARPKPYVDAATHVGGSTVVVGSNTYTFAGAAIASACTAVAPCWTYGNTIYSNATAVAAINGVTGTPNASTGLIAASINATTGVAAAAAPQQSNIAKSLNDQLAATANSELALVRRKGGARYDVTLTDLWKGYASYTQEQRKGSRPFAMNEGNISTEIAEPIDYATHEFLTGLHYADSLTQANLRASASLFRNNISTLNVQYPFLAVASANGAIQTATYDLYPDNDAVNLKGEFSRSLPDFFKGRFTASLSWGTNRQNANLLAPISEAQNADLIAAGIDPATAKLSGTNAGYAANSALISNWNTTAALSQQTAQQRIDNRLLDLGLALRPGDDLSVKGSLRSYQTANKGGYTAYNPLTGQFGRGFAEGNSLTNLDAVVGLQPGATAGQAGNCYTPPGYATTPNTGTPACTFAAAVAGLYAVNGNNVPVFGQARSINQTNYGLSADYDLSRTSSLAGSIEREDFKRNYREREKTWEDKIKLGFVNRGMENATLRTSYEVDRKRGGDYLYRTFGDLGTGLPGLTIQEQIDVFRKAGLPATTVMAANLFTRYSSLFRKYDQADRDQQILNLRINYAALEDLDLGVFFQAKDIKYPDSFYGIKNDKQNSVSLDLAFQPTPDQTLYGFYSFQQGKKSSYLNSGIATPGNTSCTLANFDLYGYSACSDYVLDASGNTVGARPLSSAWTSETGDKNHALGVGFQRNAGSFQFGVDYSYSRSTTSTRYSFGNASISAVPEVQTAAALIAGSALPDMTFVQQIVSFNVLVPINKKLSVRFFDRYELGRVKDWHYDGVITGLATAMDGTTLLLDAGPQDYHTNVVGVFIQYKL